jgi:hypothetical protein
MVAAGDGEDTAIGIPVVAFLLFMIVAYVLGGVIGYGIAGGFVTRRDTAQQLNETRAALEACRAEHARYASVDVNNSWVFNHSSSSSLERFHTALAHDVEQLLELVKNIMLAMMRFYLGCIEVGWHIFESVLFIH